MGGYINASGCKFAIGLEYSTRVIDVLDWGRRIWSSVPVDDRGVIFELSFIRGVKQQRLMFMQQVSSSFATFNSSIINAFRTLGNLFKSTRL
jgi:hypothetical protein